MVETGVVATSGDASGVYGNCSRGDDCRWRAPTAACLRVEGTSVCPAVALTTDSRTPSSGTALLDPGARSESGCGVGNDADA